MLETHLQSPVTRRRLRAGPAADHIDGFADWLHRCGYAPTTIDGMLRCLAGWTDWMLASGFGAQELLSGFEACRVALQEKRRSLLQPRSQSAILDGSLGVHPISPTAGEASAACDSLMRQ